MDFTNSLFEEMRTYNAYAAAVLEGRLTAADFIFCTEDDAKKLAAPELPADGNLSQRLFANAEKLLDSLEGMLSRPENAPKISQAVSFLKDARLRALAIPLLFSVNEKLSALAAKAETETANSALKQAAQTAWHEMARIQAPLTPYAFAMLCEKPQLALARLGWLIPECDYSRILDGLGTSPNEQKIALHLVQTGAAQQLHRVIRYLETLPGDTLPPDWEEALMLAVVHQTNLKGEAKAMDRLQYQDLYKQLLRISHRKAVILLLLLLNANMVVSWQTFTPNIYGGPITSAVSESSCLIGDLNRLIDELKDPALNILVCRSLLQFPNLRENYEQEKLCKTILQVPQPAYEGFLACLAYVQKCFSDHEHANCFLRECMKAVCHCQTPYANMFETIQFKHWAMQKACLWHSRGLSVNDDADFVFFYAESPNSLHWKTALPAIIASNLQPETRKDVIMRIAAVHSSEAPEFLNGGERQSLVPFAAELPPAWQAILP